MTEATKVPKLKRNDRTTETREKTVRRKAWAPPSRLDAPEPPPGYKHRWIRVESGGADDRANVSAKLREGYELVRADEYPDFDSGVQDDGKHAGVIGVGGLLLARIPEETLPSTERQQLLQLPRHLVRVGHPESNQWERRKPGAELSRRGEVAVKCEASCSSWPLP